MTNLLTTKERQKTNFEHLRKSNNCIWFFSVGESVHSLVNIHSQKRFLIIFFSGEVAYSVAILPDVVGESYLDKDMIAWQDK